MKNRYLWEVSFECGNKVGGIWTVITSKNSYMRKKFKDNYFTIGFYDKNKFEIIKKPVPVYLKKIFKKLNKKGIKLHYGLWAYANNSKIILIDSKEFMEKEINSIKKEFWEKYKLDSLHSTYEFDEPLAWSVAVGMFLEEIKKTVKGTHLIQLHEWLTGGVLLYLNKQLPIVFTTHATVVGRASSGNFKGRNPDILSKELKVWEKHQLEKLSANFATVFTTVSDSTSKEAHKVLGRKPDFVTYNALNKNSLSSLNLLKTEKMKFETKLKNFVKKYFSPYYSLKDEMRIIHTSGRYEFVNKGYGLFIDALGELNKHLKSEKSEKTLVVFILVPTGTISVNDDVARNFYSNSKVLSSIPPLSAFKLAYDENQDKILCRLKEKGLMNKEEDRVKVIYYPKYITHEDSLLGLGYEQFMIASDMGVFLSKYEPWGYTPMESAAFLSEAITTTSSGFGSAVKIKSKKGIHLIDLTKDPIIRLTNILERFIKQSDSEKTSSEESSYKVIKKHFIWDNVINNYFEAYDFAEDNFLLTRERRS